MLELLRKLNANCHNIDRESPEANIQRAVSKHAFYVLTDEVRDMNLSMRALIKHIKDLLILSASKTGFLGILLTCAIERRKPLRSRTRSRREARVAPSIIVATKAS